MCELTGHAVPHGGVLGLYESQIRVEIFLHHNMIARDDKAAEAEEVQQSTYVIMNYAFFLGGYI